MDSIETEANKLTEDLERLTGDNMPAANGLLG
jgi:hypothetical protein